MTNSYTDPTSVANIPVLDTYETVNYDSLHVIEPDFQILFAVQTYITNSIPVNDPMVSSTAERIYTPNPKRGFVAITTYPPVYQRRTNGATTQILVPRIYPPIYIEPRGRNTR